MSARLVPCPDCEGEGVVLGRYRGVAGCETEDVDCDTCGRTGTVWDDSDGPFDTLEEAAGLR